MAENQQEVVDYGRPMVTLTKAEILELEKPITIELYRNSPVAESTFKHDNKYYRKKGPLINPGSLIKLSGIYPDIRHYYEVAPRVDVQEPHPTVLSSDLRIYTAALTSIIAAKKELVINPSGFIAWISLFFVYNEDFSHHFIEYLANPDQNLILKEEFTQEELSAILLTSMKDHQMRRSDIRATCHLILISLLKNFSENEQIRHQQLGQYINKRSSAAYSAMSLPEGTIVIHHVFFLTFSNVIKGFPKLTRCLLMFALENPLLPEIQTATTLLASSAMATVQAMIEFCETDEFSEAHLDDRVLSDISIFYTAMSRLRTSLGAQWPYYRIIMPNDQTLAATRFPNLAGAAISYKKENGPISFKQLVDPQGCPKPIIEKAKIKTNQITKVHVQAGRGGDVKERVARQLGLEFRMALGNEAAREHIDRNILIQGLQDLFRPAAP